MKTILRYVTLCFLVVLSVIQSHAQNITTNNFYKGIKSYNLSTVWTADSIQTEKEEGGTEKVKRAEILGFIGSNFQRLQIHFTSIQKNIKNPYQYFAFGKTMFKGKVCAFKGTITIKQAELHTSDISNYQQGYSTCEVILYEDKKGFSSGFIKGKLKSNFAIDNQKHFRYDALLLVSDSFSNNEFVGTWTSYKTGIFKKCNWGDYRIPDCGDLDSGAGEFYVSDKYVQNGWTSYMLETKAVDAGIVKHKVKNKNWWE